jgi:hypothetical protein
MLKMIYNEGRPCAGLPFPMVMLDQNMMVTDEELK